MIAGDTAPCEMTRAVAWQADLLVHEATFCDEDAERAEETGHSTARGAAELAAAAEVELLALTHISSRYPVSALQDEARAAFERTIVPRDFDRVEIPLPGARAARARARRGLTERLTADGADVRPCYSRRAPLTRSREARKDVPN